MTGVVRGGHRARAAAEVAAPRQLGLPGRLLLGALMVAGVIVAAPSGFGLYFFIPYAGVGALLVIRRPRTSIGWILLALGSGFVLVTLGIDATAEQFVDGSLAPITAILAVVSAAGGAALFFLFALLAIVFPSGRLPGGRWGVAARLGIGVGLALVAAGAIMPTISVSLWGATSGLTVPNPAAILPGLPIWRIVTPDAVILPVAALMVAAAVSLLVRFRRATGVERQQLRWLTAALSFVVVAVLSGFVMVSVVPGTMDSGIAWLGAIIAFPCVPVAIGIAVLRYRLYEIDRVVSRTIGWVVVTAILATVFAVVVVGLQVVLEPVTENNTLAVAASTLVAAALFQPLRGRVQRAVDRRFNRSRVDAEGAIGGFVARVRDEMDLAQLRTALVETADEAVRPVAATVWLRGGKGAR